MRFEDKQITFGPKPLIEDEYTMEKLLRKREAYFSSHRPEIDDFKEYKEEKRAHDKKELSRLKELFASGNKDEESIFMKNLASVYEGAIFDLIESNNFLGKDCRISPTSEWDDIKN